MIFHLLKIERLREEGSQLLQEQQQFLKEQLKNEMEVGQDNLTTSIELEDLAPKLKVGLLKIGGD